MSQPPKNQDESLKLAAFRLCHGGDLQADDFRTHYETCHWCQSYVTQFQSQAPHMISEVGWWSGRADSSAS